MGVDLAGSPRRPTGVCLLQGMTVAAWATVYADEEIAAFVARAAPELVAVDAPLSLPPGRASIEDRGGEHFRACDRELLRRRIRFFPVTLGPMRALTARGLRLKAELEAAGHAVVEVYPGAAQDLWGIGRKQRGLEALRSGLEGLGLKGLAPGMNGDELDAVTGALVGRLCLLGRAEALGDPAEGLLYVPGRRRRSTAPLL